VFVDVLVVFYFGLVQISDATVDESVDALLGFGINLGQLRWRQESPAKSANLLHLMLLVRRHTLTLFVPAHHCIGETVGLEAD
jgi:hypothetical protein